MPVKIIFLEKSESSLERPWSPCITIDTRTWPAGIELLPNELFNVEKVGNLYFEQPPTLIPYLQPLLQHDADG